MQIVKTKLHYPYIMDEQIFAPSGVTNSYHDHATNVIVEL
jgi:hypothetical protein